LSRHTPQLVLVIGGRMLHDDHPSAQRNRHSIMVLCNAIRGYAASKLAHGTHRAHTGRQGAAGRGTRGAVSGRCIARMGTTPNHRPLQPLGRSVFALRSAPPNAAQLLGTWSGD
jgi:hypothetical protein